jgi:hypothetical protein
MSDVTFDLKRLLQSVDGNTRQLISRVDNAHAIQKRELQAHFDQLTANQRRHYEKSRSDFVQNDAENRKMRIQLHILQSLQFAEMSHRSDALTPAHDRTFKWLFQAPRITGKRWDSLQLWLTAGSGLYWVSEKAGSGKSTLMKFLWNQQMTWDCLNSWAGDAQIIVRAFYFWNSGTVEQRSHSGCLRSILYEVLKKKNDLIGTVFPDEWEENCALSSHDKSLVPINWSLSRLQKGFRRLVGLASNQLRFCFFIDGLDEYDGLGGDIADHVRSVSSQSTYAKFCVSSRPWSVFETVFRGSPNLRLQDLTEDDVRAFVNDKLGSNEQIQDLKACEPENTRRLIEEVVNKAAGVFLWVYLVVKSLIGGLRDGDEISHLRSRLASLPPDLKNLYEHMLERIEPEYKEESAKIFLIFRANDYNLGVRTLDRALLHSEHWDSVNMAFAHETFPSQRSDKEARLRLTRMLSRLNSRTKGLLETHNRKICEEDAVAVLHQQTATCVIRGRGQDLRDLDRQPWASKQWSSRTSQRWRTTKSRKESLSSTTSSDDCNQPSPEISWPQESPHITFIHRTARDYLEQDHVWKRILGHTNDAAFDPRIALLSAFVWEAKTTSLVHLLGGSTYEVGSKMLRWLRSLHISGSPTADSLLEILDGVLNLDWFPVGVSTIDQCSEDIVNSKKSARLSLELRGQLPQAQPKYDHTISRHVLSDQRWSDGDPEVKQLSTLRNRWGGNALTAALSHRLHWYYEPKIKDGAQGLPYAKQKVRYIIHHESSQQENKLPLLAYALRFHRWSASGVASNPDVDALSTLLKEGHSPNSLFARFSVWQYALQYLHIVHTLPKKRPDLPTWLHVFKLSLQHGADPYACCVGNREVFTASVALLSDGDMGKDEPAITTHGLYNAAPHPHVRVDPCEDASNCVQIAHRQHHSVSTVVHDVFVAQNVPGSDALVALLEEKKKASAQPARKRRRVDVRANHPFSKGPGWVS